MGNSIKLAFFLIIAFCATAISSLRPDAYLYFLFRKDLKKQWSSYGLNFWTESHILQNLGCLQDASSKMPSKNEQRFGFSQCFVALSESMFIWKCTLCL